MSNVFDKSSTYKCYKNYKAKVNHKKKSSYIMKLFIQARNAENQISDYSRRRRIKGLHIRKK